MSNVDTVKDIYAAFGRGDVPAILDMLDENVTWDAESSITEVPWLKPHHGRAEVGAFFLALEPLQFDRFEPYAFLADGDMVIGLVNLQVTYKPTGKQYSFSYHGHLFRFGASGKVVDFRHLTDTHLWVRMMQGE